MRSKIFTLLIIANTLIANLNITACGYYEYEWEYRPMTFQAMLPNMQSMQPFIYTTAGPYSIMNSDLGETDRQRNIEEWQKATSPKVSLKDIYTIQYETDPNDFVIAYTNNSLENYKNNTFIQFLLSDKKYKPLLEYFVFAKNAESTEFDIFEEWEDQYNSYITKSTNVDLKKALISEAENKIKKTNSLFLKERYAFQLVRLYWQTNNYEKSNQAYDLYFKTPNPNSLMNIWACLFNAMSLDKLNQKEKANYYYIYAFDNCSEKKLRSVQLFNRSLPIPSTFTNNEQSVAYVINSVNYPGRALDKLEKIYNLNSNSKYFPFLIMREINKLEDWMISSIYLKTGEDPFDCAYQYDWKEKENVITEIKEKNYETDLQYLKKLKEFILKLKANTKVEKDYYSIALAHLSILEENKEDTKLYLSQIPTDADSTILRQQIIDHLWLSVKTEDINTNAFKSNYAKNIKKLKALLPSKNKEQDPENFRIIYTLDLALSNEYKKRGDIVTYGLLKNISDKDRGNNYVDSTDCAYCSYYYSRIRQFDYNASASDIDKLITLLKKKDKTEFEQYICNQNFNSIDAYYDLKGTIAFRNRDLQTAYSAFSNVNTKYEDNTYFSNWLNEDPFVPKNLKSNEDRDFSYKFNKATFIKELIHLEAVSQGKDKTKAANAYLKLGHAFFNTSYWGNAWMMTSYAWSGNDVYSRKVDCLPQWRKNYMTASIALEYYEKAHKLATNNEQKAYASLMLNRVHWHNIVLNGNKQSMQLAVKYAEEYFDNYKNKTLFDKQNECLGYVAFID